MKKAKILIVDDYQENITALANLIAADDIEVHSAKNADAALELLTYNDFALALLDIQMPVVTGLELAQLIRGVKKYQHLPIIFVTAQQHDNSLIFQGYENGAVDLLFKPLNPYVVRSKVRVFVELSLQRDLLQTHVDELEKLRLEAEAANIAKSQFLANMSHEIRTPLAAVMGFSDLLINDDTTAAEKQEWAAAVRRNGNLLMRLIDDILDISKIEADRLEFDRAPFSLKDFLQDVNSTLAFKAKDKNIELEFHLPEECQKYYSSDSTRIKQILLNVIGNAIKFTTKGKVRVDVSLEPASPRSEILLVRVQDEGIGLSPEQVNRLFQPFSQGDASTRRQFGGTGLGLAISRRVARALGGEIRLVRSTPGAGSTFEIKILLPYAEGPESKAVLADKMFSKSTEEAKIATDFSQKHILAVDDSPDNLFLIEMFLKSSGVHLTCVESGKEAVEKVKNQNFDLILMDMQMAGMDGREATGIIREMGYKGPVLAFTAHAMQEEHKKCKAAGCDDVIVKPIDSKKLIEGLRPYLT
jgi:two-component system, sensor histidine kinase